MKRKRIAVEQITRMHRLVEVHLSEEKSIKLVTGEPGITEGQWLPNRLVPTLSVEPGSLGKTGAVTDSTTSCETSCRIERSLTS